MGHRMQNSLLYGVCIKCIFAVCGHNHHTVNKIHSFLFFLSSKSLNSQSSCLGFLSNMISFCSCSALDRWRTVPY